MQASRRTSRELAHAAVGGIPSPSPTSTYVFLQVFCFFPFSFLTLSMLFIASFSLRGDEGTLTVAFNVPVAASGRGGEDAAQAPYVTGPNVDAYNAAELREPYKQYTGLYTFVDEPARFGPRITDAGVRGRLFLAEPLDALALDLRVPRLVRRLRSHQPSCQSGNQSIYPMHSVPFRSVTIVRRNLFRSASQNKPFPTKSFRSVC